MMNEYQEMLQEDSMFLSEAIGVYGVKGLKEVYDASVKGYNFSIQKAKDDDKATEKLNKKFVAKLARCKKFLKDKDYSAIVSNMKSDLKDIVKWTAGLLGGAAVAGGLAAVAGMMGIGVIAPAIGFSTAMTQNYLQTNQITKACETPEGKKIINDYIKLLETCVNKTK